MRACCRTSTMCKHRQHQDDEGASLRSRGKHSARSGVRRAEGTDYPADGVGPTVSKDIVAALRCVVLGPAILVSHQGPSGV
eukprot:887502-Alexandrium_andersonii.AAC.1